MSTKGNVWFCKVGFAHNLRSGSDLPMRQAVDEALKIDR